MSPCNVMSLLIKGNSALCNQCYINNITVDLCSLSVAVSLLSASFGYLLNDKTLHVTRIKIDW